MKQKTLSGLKVVNEFEPNKYTLNLLKFVSIFISKKRLSQVDLEYVKGEKVELKLVDLLDGNKILAKFSFPPNTYKIDLDSINDNSLLESVFEELPQDWKRGLKISNTFRSTKNVITPLNCHFLNISGLLFSPKNQKNTFEPIVGDWQEEYLKLYTKKKFGKHVG